MAGKKTAVFGIYADRSSVDRGVEALKAAGFSNNDVSVLFPDKQGTKDFAHEKETKAPEGAATGAGTGAVLGGGLGWLAGIGALAIPGLGPFIAAGPMTGRPGWSRRGRRSRWSYRRPDRDGDTGIRGQTIPRPGERRRHFLLSVHSDSSEETKRAKDILERTGAQDVSPSGEASSDKSTVASRRDVA